MGSVVGRTGMAASGSPTVGWEGIVLVCSSLIFLFFRVILEPILALLRTCFKIERLSENRIQNICRRQMKK
jgi:hypothetical protein